MNIKLLYLQIKSFVFRDDTNLVQYLVDNKLLLPPRKRPYRICGTVNLRTSKTVIGTNKRKVSDCKTIYVVKAASFGAVPDGVTDCAPAIQESIEVFKLVNNFQEQIEFLIKERDALKKILDSIPQGFVENCYIDCGGEKMPIEYHLLSKNRGIWIVYLKNCKILPIEKFKELEDKLTAFEAA